VQSTAAGAPPPARVRNVLSRAARLTRSDVAKATGGEAGEVSVLFCGDGRMRTLNARYRRKDSSTDVLAFPASGAGLLGDIVVSVPYARRQAGRRGEPVSREIDRLLVHGFLHLLGYDHETDRGEMDALENRVRRSLRIVERASA
jgi:probable rRNA maturation factor